MELDQAILTSVIGLVSGGIGSLIAPWMNWGIEKRRLRYDKRVKTINDLKMITAEKDFDRIKFINSVNYEIVRPYFSIKTINEIERPLEHLRGYVGFPIFDFDRKIILEEIAKMEKKWKII